MLVTCTDVDKTWWIECQTHSVTSDTSSFNNQMGIGTRTKLKAISHISLCPHPVIARLILQWNRVGVEEAKFQHQFVGVLLVSPSQYLSPLNESAVKSVCKSIFLFQSNGD